MRVALYVRESSADTSKAPDILNQEARGRQWAKDNGYEVVQVYSDNGYSGGDWNRPAWNQSKRDARRHLFKILWVWSQDRIARDTEQFLNYYREMKSQGIQIFNQVTNEYIDMETLGGRVTHTALAQGDELMRLLTSEKVKRAYQSNKKQGKAWGRKATPISPAILEKIKADYATGKKGYRTIAKETGINYQRIRRAIIGEKK